MRATLDLPEGLVAAAQKACGAKTKTMTVVIALQQLVNAAKIEQLRALRGKIHLDVGHSRRQDAEGFPAPLEVV